MANKRIIELDVTDVVEDDDFLAIDSVSGKTRKIKPIKIGATYEIEDGDHSFTLVGSNGYSHTVDIPYDSVSMTQAEYNALTPAQKADGTARFLTDAESDVESELWSKVGRQTLDTDSQVLSNAVNELVAKTDDTNSDVTQLNSSLSTKLNANLVQFFSAPTSGTNLNTLISPGIAVYQIGNITQYTNAPTGKGTTGLLIVTRASSYIVQRFYSNSTFTYRSSYDGGSGWNNWI